MVDILLWLLFSLIVIQRMIELRIARRNREWVLALGAIEYGAGHYMLFYMLHIGWFISWITEYLTAHSKIDSFWPLWLALFMAAQALRYWCIHSLGRYWNTRILVIPGATLVTKGPYQYLPHPNYLAVAVEIFTVPAMFGAWLTALVFSIANAILILGVRIPKEEQALKRLRY